MNSRTITPDDGAIGILDGGQLGMMLAMAALKAGYRVCVFAPPGDNPAFNVKGVETFGAAWDDEEALARFAESVAAATLAFENIPTKTLSILQRSGLTVRPRAKVLHITQDRLLEKQFMESIGLSTAPYMNWNPSPDWNPDKLDGLPPAILKTRRNGFDGRGQIAVNSWSEAEAAWRTLGQVPCILEQRINFYRELSVIVARNQNGDMTHFGPFANRHENGILRETTYPLNTLTDPTREQAIKYGYTIAQALEVEGLITLEMFVTHDQQILGNELAPRVHNSGHGTIEAFDESQFGLAIKAITNQPLPLPQLRCGHMQMVNLLGHEQPDTTVLASNQTRYTHLYGKVPREGRKVGHTTILTH